ncbi:MAG: mandelate racemase [Betaproteobacteria bacterium]|nr:MAG: mandelate racemase [Betaproteobacteria bacterium]
MSLTKIEEVRTTQVLAPIRRPLRNASGFIPSFPVVLIDLVRDDGVVGRAYTQIYFAELLPALEASIQSLATLIKGMPASPRDVYNSLMERMRLWGVKNTFCTAMGGLDMALWDAYARGRNEPLYTTLGAQPCAHKPYYSVGLYDEESVIEVAEEAVADNYPGLKIKAGFPTLAEDLAAVRAAKRVLGDRALMIDYNQALTVAEAMIRCKALDDEGLTWIEEPIIADDYEGNAKLADAITTPIQIGENFNGPEDMDTAMKANATDYVMIDPQFIRGVTGWIETAAMARAAGREMSSHTFVEASSHLLCATPTAHWLEHMDVVGQLLAEPFPLVDGALTPPDRPGLGMEWNDEMVNKHRAGAK